MVIRWLLFGVGGVLGVSMSCRLLCVCGWFVVVVG